MFSLTIRASSRQLIAHQANPALAASSNRLNSFRYLSSVHENDPELLEREKQRNLSGTQHHTSTPHDHAPGWNEHLASASEANVMADKSTNSLEEMTEKTVKYVQSRHHADDTIASRQSAQNRDSVEGPLGTAKGEEHEGYVEETTTVKKTFVK